MTDRPDLVKGAIIDFMKSKSVIYNEIYNHDPEEIKEAQWQGTIFNYPNIRFKLDVFDSDDCFTRYNATISVFTQDASSSNADRIAGIIKSVLHDKQLSQNGLLMSLQVVSITPAIRSDANTWQTQVKLRGTVSG